MKKCPYCAEDIQEEAGFCRYCGRDLVAKVKNNAQATGGSLLIEPSFMEILYSFQGRIGRKTYWAGICILITMLSIVSFIVVVVTQPTSNESYTIIGVLVSCPFLVGSLALSVKRLHDLGYSGWMMVLNIIPVLGIWLDAVLGFRKGIKGRNNYGGEPTTNILFEKVGTILGVLFLVLIALIVIVMYLNPSPTKQILIPTSYPTLKPTTVPTVHVATKPTPSCLSWNEVTSLLAGQTVCVYGVVTDHVENYDARQTFFYFGDRSKFFITSLQQWTTMKGSCISVTGEIKLNTYSTPYILAEQFFQCP
jgi:uncharacterized membrane protein YhaH (DUF805 family)